MSISPVRLLAVLVVAIALAACDGSGSADTTGQPGPSSTATAVTSTPPDAAGEVISYAFEVGDVYTYDLVLDQHIVLESEGSAEAVADQDVPSSADVTIASTGRFVFEVSPGPQTGFYSIAIEGTFAEATVEGTADGEPVDDASDIEALGAIQPVSTVVVVDSQGRIQADSTSPTDALGLGATPLSGLSGDLGRLVGPVLSADPVAVGDTWTDTSTDPNLGDAPVETTMTATVTGTEDVEGTEALVIDTTSTTGQADIDLSEFFGGFMGAFADSDDAEAQAALEAMVDQLVFRITIDASSTEGTAWFDPAAGRALRSITTGPPTVFHMDVALPDEETGELASYTMRLDVTQTLDYTLVAEDVG